MGYFEWYEAARPFAAQAHLQARAVSKTPQAYAFATTLIKGYVRARDRGVKKSRKSGLSWPEIPADVKAPFRALVDGFESIVSQCTAPKPQYCVRTGAVIYTTDILNAIGYDTFRESYLNEVESQMRFPSISLADFTPFLKPSNRDIPGSPPEIQIDPIRLDALGGVYQWLADLKESKAAGDRLASLLRFHYGGDPFAAQIVSMTGWITARSDEEKHRWSAAHHALDVNRGSHSYDA